MKNSIFKRSLAILLAMVVLIGTLPLAGVYAAAETDYYNRVADASTIDGWKEFFPLTSTADSPLTTENAGGVWTDKSVFTNTDAFPNSVSMADPDKNFLTVLSAIAANKEIVGYSAVPTDTIFVLDLSMSMESDDVSRLVDATNEAIKKLQGENENNRIGVVLYSGNTDYDESVSRLLPLDRYTTTRADGDFIRYRNNNVSVYSEVRGTKAFTSKSRSTGTYTYIQAGLWEAYQMFEEVPDDDIMIGDNNWQAGEYRMPILVLMTDGAPTNGTNAFDNVGDGNFGSNYPYGLKAGDSFFVQLTAAYVKNRIENKYKVHEEYGAGRSLFYTLGFNISAASNPNQENDNNIAYSVVNPEGTTLTDAYWNTYNSNGSVQVTVTGSRQNSTKTLTATKNSYATSKAYVDEYFPASGTGLTAAFDNIVEEILIQSRYYPTHLEGGSPDFSGYVEFTDTLGEYMEVKQITGILLGETLFSGRMMSSKLADTSASGLGTPENPTLLGNEFIRSVQTRLGISGLAEARALVSAAYNAKQLYYKSETEWSNYIAWYADAEGNYIAHWDGSATATAPAGAVYKMKSYGFLGETDGSIKNSDMMYVTVQVRTDIVTGVETVIWKVPAALVPMVTYLVEVEGTSVDTATNVRVSVEDENVSPIRLLYETGLRSDLNAFNITRISDEEHIAADGHTRIFWNNYFDIEAPSHDDHITTMSEFTPNKENERFYYTFDSAVHKKVGQGYEIVSENEGLDPNGTYYHRRYIFSAAENAPIFFYQQMSKASIQAAIDNGFNDNFESLEHNTVGAWVVPAGTPARELNMYDRQKAVNLTDSAHMIFHPYMTEENNLVEVDMNLGNNGLLSVTPATGLKISKTVDIFEPGTSDLFKFRITAGESGLFNSWITPIGETPSGEPEEVRLVNGVYEFEMRRDQTFWLTGLSANTAYTVEEISENADYKLKSVHLNGNATGSVAAGTIAAYLIDDVAFVNTAVGEGDLVITKQVVDQAGNAVDINDSVDFTAEVTLTDKKGSPVSGSFETAEGRLTVPASGKFTITLAEGESFILRGLIEGTRYAVEEKNIPQGFALNTAKSNLSGVVDASGNDQALIVNSYKPVSTSGSDINVTVNKVISGNRTNWLTGESYTFVLEQAGRVVATKTISHSDTEKTALFALSSETFEEAGTYSYRIYEQKGNQGGITYDSTDRRFNVTVADADMDGDLEVTAVTNLSGTVVSERYNVSATFTNLYAPSGSASVTLNILKRMNGNHRLDGYRFALYDADPRNSSEENEIARSTITNSAGQAAVNLTYAANAATVAGTKYNYWLAEINTGDPNISYDDRVYPVVVTVYDDEDGTISADVVISNLPTGETQPIFENTYVPSASDFITISGTKEIRGDRVLNNREFAFILTADTQGAPLPAVTTVRNAANGSFTFEAIEFTDAHKGQNFVYTVKEDASNKIGGFTYDAAEYKVYVSVIDNGDATLTASITEIKKVNGGETTVSDIKFVNTYDAQDAVVTLSATKLLTGKTMQADEFAFVITALTENAPMPADSSATNKADGTITFGEITFDKAGVYKYTISETAGNDGNYVYDKSVYTVTVTVIDNSTGILTARVSLQKDTAPSTEIVFRNSFIPSAIEQDIYVDFGGTKELSGRPLEDGEFEFTLINAANGEQIGQSVKNDADGNIKFPAVVLPEAGIYHFKMVETIGDEAGISYDTSAYHIRYEVVQLKSGDLSIVDKRLVKATVVKEDVDGTLTEVTRFENITQNGEIIFNNSYKAAPVHIAITATKTLIGRELKAEEFCFVLYDEAGQEIETVTNDENGNILFAPITIEEAGTYTYTVNEVAGDEEGMTYDTTLYTVTVTVTDNLDGTFKVEYSYSADRVSAEEVSFVNNYTAPTPESQIPVTGDFGNNLVLWIALFFISGGLLGAVAVCKKSKGKN